MPYSHPLPDDRRLLRKLASNTLKLGRHATTSFHRKSPLYELFHENTKLGRLSARAYSEWILNYLRIGRDRTPLQGGKVYTLMDRCDLPPVEARTELERVIADRRSTRTFSGAAVRLDELARLLFFAYGRTDPGGRFRAVASGGALYPLELYAVALNVEGLEAGVYHYGVETGHLDVVRRGGCLAALEDDLVNLHGIDVANASLLIVVTAAFRRTTIKYLDRGYRMILMEAGEVAQNLCLLATSMNLAACLLGGFDDDRLSEFLDTDGVEEAPLLAAVVGRLTAAA
jgi:SagB-type dehydrogenase family enzyme